MAATTEQRRFEGLRIGAGTATLGRFLVAGGLAYIVNQVALVLLHDVALTSMPDHKSTALGFLDPRLLVASLIAVELSIVVRFAVNDRWTFRGRTCKPLLRRFYESNLASLASPIIAVAAVNVLTPLTGISYLITNSVGIALGLAWNWFWSSRVVWKQDAPPQASQAA